MTTAIYIIGALITLGVLVYVVKLFVGTYLKYRGTRVVTCPETKEYVAVNVAAKDAALSATTIGDPFVHLKSCTRWPERKDCGQECLAQIEAAPHDCLFNSILKNWYEGKSCVFCQKPIGEIDWIEYKPALLGPDNRTVEWSEIKPEKVHETLSTHRPVCFDCHIAETFRRQFPELVVDRPNKEKVRSQKAG
jgi:hypothetical protein